jgi:amidase
VAERYAAAREISDGEMAAAKSAKDAVVARMDAVFAGGTVVCLPTAPMPAPPRGQRLSTQRSQLSRIITLTCTAGLTGAAQFNLPLAEVDGLPVGLSLMGARGSDEVLIAFAREVASALKS